MPDFKARENNRNSYGLMNEAEYDVMFRFESDYWWYRALHHLVLRLVRREARGRDEAEFTIVDCGCGTGGMLQRLRVEFPRAAGFDLSEQAVAYCRSRGLADVSIGSITDFDYGERKFDAALSLDVLCNLDVESFKRALEHIRCALKPGGAFIFNLPAFNSMRSEHDRAVGIYRRFRRHLLDRELREAGFRVEKINYRITYPFPLIWLARTIKKRRLPGKEEAHSDLAPLPRFLNALLTGLTKFENVVVFKVPMPFGLSVFGVARRPV